MSPKHFIDLCQYGTLHGEVDVGNYGKRLKRHPHGLYSYESKSGHKKFGIQRAQDVKWYDVTDWRHGDFKYAQQDVARWAGLI